MVSVYGLNKRIGNRSFYDPRAEATFTKPYSEETARIIDEEAGAIIERGYAKAREILEENKDKLDALAERLLEREVIFKEDLIDILGPRAWEVPEPAEKKADVVADSTTEASAEPSPESTPDSAPESTVVDPSLAEDSDQKDEEAPKGTDENAA